MELSTFEVGIIRQEFLYEDIIIKEIHTESCCCDCTAQKINKNSY